jgi:hypothetical protein
MWTRRLSELAVVGALFVGAGTARAQQAPAAATAEDPLEQYRERFKLGMERYKAGALAEAIGYWEPIYRELGEQKGYRLAYNLGVTYAELGDVTRAADRLQSFLAETEARRARGQTVAPIVEKEEADARARIDAFVAARGRIHVQAGVPARAAQVDASEPRLAGFVAWVTPGQHTVTFAPGTPQHESKTIEVQAGELVDVAPSPPPPPPPPAASQTIPPPSASVAVAPPPEPYMRHEIDHPFSPTLLFVGGGLTLAASIGTGALYLNAQSMHDRLGDTYSAADGQSFYNARTGAYIALTGAVALAAATAGLAAWYFLGTQTREVFVTPAGVAGRF